MKNVSIKRQLLAAIAKTDHSVTIPDIVAATGVDFTTVTTVLNDLAYELKANLDVTDRGIIYYRFPKDLHYRYFSNRILEFLTRIGIAIMPVLSFLFQISFGLVLLVSITIVFLIMLVIQSLVTVYSGNTNDVLLLIRQFIGLLRQLRLFRISSFQDTAIKLNQTDEKNASPATDKADIVTPDPSVEQTQTLLRLDDKGFLLNCYALLFGPENPNKHFDNERYQAAAQLIKANAGMILPEQLAPLIGSPATQLEGAFPVLSKFHGVPAATPSGHLVYKFPEMQVAGAEKHENVPSRIKMKKLRFSDIDINSIKPILLLALANFLGTLFFWWLLYIARSSESGTEQLFLILAIYASFFLFFPAFRWIYMQWQNLKIRKYNAKIDLLANQLNTPTEELVTALTEIAKIRSDEARQTGEHLVYTTSKDFLEQEAEQMLERINNEGHDSDELSA